MFAFLLFDRKEAIESYLKDKQSKGVMLDPKKTYGGVPYYFGIDPVSAADCYLALIDDVNNNFREFLYHILDFNIFILISTAFWLKVGVKTESWK